MSLVRVDAFPRWDCINGGQRKSARSARSWLARSVLPSLFMHKLGRIAGFSACHREIDLQRMTHRWRKTDSNRWSPHGKGAASFLRKASSIPVTAAGEFTREGQPG